MGHITHIYNPPKARNFQKSSEVLLVRSSNHHTFDGVPSCSSSITPPPHKRSLTLGLYLSAPLPLLVLPTHQLPCHLSLSTTTTTTPETEIYAKTAPPNSRLPALVTSCQVSNSSPSPSALLHTYSTLLLPASLGFVDPREVS